MVSFITKFQICTLDINVFRQKQQGSCNYHCEGCINFKLTIFPFIIVGSFNYNIIDWESWDRGGTETWRGEIMKAGMINVRNLHVNGPTKRRESDNSARLNLLILANDSVLKKINS